MFFQEVITEANDDVVGFGEAGQAAVAVTGSLHIVDLPAVMVADMNHDVVIPPLSAQPSFRLLVGYRAIVGVGGLGAILVREERDVDDSALISHLNFHYLIRLLHAQGLTCTGGVEIEHEGYNGV